PLPKLAPPPDQRKRPASRGVLRRNRRLRPTPRLVDHGACPARRAHRRDDLIPRPPPLRAVRAARLTALIQTRSSPTGATGTTSSASAAGTRAPRRRSDSANILFCR